MNKKMIPLYNPFFDEENMAHEGNLNIPEKGPAALYYGGVMSAVSLFEVAREGIKILYYNKILHKPYQPKLSDRVSDWIRYVIKIRKGEI